MNLLQMSGSAAVLVLVVAALRALTMHRLPKRTFLALWGVVLLRLLLPFSIPSALSVYNLAGEVPQTINPAMGFPAVQGTGLGDALVAISPALPGAEPQIPWLTLVWAAGAIGCALYFALGYLHCRRKFATATPVQGAVVERWRADHPSRRPVAVRESDRIAAPLTYGVLRPVILLPKRTDWEEAQLCYILTHEYLHIRRWDALAKLVMVTALCLHWFNPLVWLMFILANRDLELSCDEAVLRAFGPPAKAAYARVLIGMEEQKGDALPLCNSFSKNAVEERITAIMRTKKTTLLALLAAVVVVVGVSIAFATSAMQATTPSGGKNVGDYERQKLQDFQFAGYRSMTVAAYQQKAWQLKDTGDYHTVLEQISQNNMFYGMRDNNNPAAAFLFYILEPLTAEGWQTRDFGGAVQAPEDAQIGDPAMLEYTLSMTILRADSLTVGDYDTARQAVMDELQAALQQKTNDQLMDGDAVRATLDNAIAVLKTKWQSDALRFEVAYDYRPLGELSDETAADIAANWEASLAPYLAFGVTYELDKLTGQAKLYWNGSEIDSIFDEQTGTWIANSAGSSRNPNAAAVLAVYTGDQLTGLRMATAEEQARWADYGTPQQSPAPQNATEPRQYLNGSAEDYRSLLALKTASYRQQSVADFNAALLDWGNQDFDRTQRIQEDVGRDDFAVTLSADERVFVSLTTTLSNTENAQQIKSQQTGKPEQDPWYGGIQLNKDMTAAWCSLWYQFPYHIADKAALTVVERDRCISGFVAEVQAFWEQTELDALLQMTEADVVAVMQKAAAKHSTALLTISIDTEQVQFEHQDERGRT